MDELQELEHSDHGLEEPPPRHQRRSPFGPTALVIVIALAALVAFLGYRFEWWGGGDDGEPVSVAEQQEPGSPAELPAATAPPLELPALDASDAAVRELVALLSSSPRLATWLANDELVRRFTVAVVNLAEGSSPSRHVPFMGPASEFEGYSADDRMLVDPHSFARYDPIAEVFEAVDTEGAVQLYRNLYPLMDEAYRDLGYPSGGFDEALLRAFRELLATPVPAGEIELVPKVASFEYADVGLESLSAACKQLLRMGPRNTVRIQAKLRELGGALGYSEADLR